MTDYIELVLDAVEDEKDAEGVSVDEGRGFGAPGSSRPAGRMADVRTEGRRDAAWTLDGGDPSVKGFARDSSPHRGAKASADGTGMATPARTLWAGRSMGAAAGTETAKLGGWGDWLAVRGSHGGFLNGLRRTASVAAGVERRGAAGGRTVVETAALPSPAVDPAALDLIYQRDARRYDGAFTLY